MKKWLNILLVSIMLLSATTITASAELTQDELRASVSLKSDGKELSELPKMTDVAEMVSFVPDGILPGGMDYGTTMSLPYMFVLKNNASVTVEYNGTDDAKYVFIYCLKFKKCTDNTDMSMYDMGIGGYRYFNSEGKYLHDGDAYALTAVDGDRCEWTHHENMLDLMSGGTADSYMRDKFHLSGGESVTFTLPEEDSNTYYLLYTALVDPQLDDLVATYVGLIFNNEKNGEVVLTTAFTDVPADAYYTEAVKWAYENGITTGTSETTFGPTETCTRGQVVTFLWRAKGCPEPTSTVNPFTDVKETDYFYKAVLWAVENGITNGMTETTFGPKETCTSGHVVTFLWRANGQPAAVAESTLVESGKWYSDAVAWADSVALLSGTDVAFAVSNNAPRADIVTYLYRDIAK